MQGVARNLPTPFRPKRPGENWRRSPRPALKNLPGKGRMTGDKRRLFEKGPDIFPFLRFDHVTCPLVLGIEPSDQVLQNGTDIAFAWLGS